MLPRFAWATSGQKNPTRIDKQSGLLELRSSKEKSLDRFVDHPLVGVNLGKRHHTGLMCPLPWAKTVDGVFAPPARVFRLGNEDNSPLIRARRRSSWPGNG